jgi:methionyl-tRNA formyltransferase
MKLNPSRERLPARPRILYMGTPFFAVPALEALVRHGHEIVGVVTQPDRPKGRGKRPASSPVKDFALSKGLDVLQPEKGSDPLFCNEVQERRTDLIIVVAFGQILRRRLLEIPRWGVINVHASLLPSYRGAAPIQRAILRNEAKTGLTIMRMDEGLDTGPILFQEEIEIGEDETAGGLQDRMSRMGGDLMIRALSHMAEHPISETDQDHGHATYAPKIERDICLIDWAESAAGVSARVRALDPRPGAFTFYQGSEIKMFSSRIADAERSDTVPGRVVESRKRLVVEAKRGAVEIRELQLTARKRMHAAEFLRGLSLPEGTVLGR